MTGPRVVVIGSGPIGSIYARTVLDTVPDASVLMIEAGPALSKQTGLNLRNLADPAEQQAGRLAAQGPDSKGLGVSVPGAVVVEGTLTARQGTHLVDDGGPHTGHAPGMPAAAISTGVGGQGVHWTCATPRPEDTERVDFIDDVEWEDVIGEAERLLHTTKDAFAEAPLGRVVRDTVAGVFDDRLPVGRKVGIFPVAVDQRSDGSIIWTGTDTILGDILDPSSPIGARFELRPSTLATRVVIRDGRAVGVELTSRRNGSEAFEAADVVVVAADAIRTPQLLWASDIRPPALGRYLTEHPVIFGVVALRDDAVAAVFPDGVPEGDIRTAAGDPVSATNRIPFSEGVHPFTTQLMHLRTSPIPLPADSPLADNAAGYVNVGFALRKFPRVEDGVSFSETETDAFGMPAATIDYSLTDREMAEVEIAFRLQAETAAALGDVVPGGEASLLPNGSSLHYQGTFRAGAVDDGTSVVDPWSRVWGIDSLYLGGNGVIPTATTVNPTLFSSALAVRGARHLAASLQETRQKAAL